MASSPSVNVSTNQNEFNNDPNLEYTYTYIVYDFDAELTFWVYLTGDIDLELSLTNNMLFTSFTNVALEVFIYEYFYSPPQWIHTKTVTLQFGNIGGGQTKVATLSTSTVYEIYSTDEVDCEINSNGLSYGVAYDTLTDEVVPTTTSTPRTSSPSPPAYNPGDNPGNEVDYSYIVRYLGPWVLIGGAGFIGYYLIKQRSKRDRPTYIPPTPVRRYQPPSDSTRSVQRTYPNQVRSYPQQTYTPPQRVISQSEPSFSQDFESIPTPRKSSVGFCPQCGNVSLKTASLDLQCTVCGNIFKDTRQ